MRLSDNFQSPYYDIFFELKFKMKMKINLSNFDESVLQGSACKKHL